MVNQCEGKFLCYVEDDPMIFSRTYDSQDDAVAATRYLVAERMMVNGAGWGAVLDVANDELVCFVEGGGLDPTGVPMISDLKRPPRGSDEWIQVMHMIRRAFPELG